MSSKVEWHGDEVKKKIKQRLEDKMEVVGEHVETEAKLTISGHHGIELKAVDTGRLMNSITHAVQSNKDSIKGLIGTNVEYGPYVELGTYKMPARPFLRTAFYNSKKKILRILGL